MLVSTSTLTPELQHHTQSIPNLLGVNLPPSGPWACSGPPPPPASAARVERIGDVCLYAGLHRFPAVCDILIAEYREPLDGRRWAEGVIENGGGDVQGKDRTLEVIVVSGFVLRCYESQPS